MDNRTGSGAFPVSRSSTPRLARPPAARRPVLPFAFALLALALLAGESRAATIPVTSNADYAFGVPPANGDGTGCTLRKALKNAIAGAQPMLDCPSGSAGADIITFSNATQIQLGTLGPLDTIPNRTITLQGPKTIRGNNSGLGQGEIFNLFSGTTLSLNGITLTNAGNSAVRLTGDGSAHLSTNASVFSGNKTDACCGGAIGGNGTIALLDTVFLNNNATTQSGAGGGAINLSSTGISTITNGVFQGNAAANDGGAIYFSGTAAIVPPATLTITNALFTLNTAHADGGANHGGGAIYSNTLNLSNLILLNNTFLSNTVDGNDGAGGAILNAQSDTLPMVVDSNKFGLNTVSSNAAATGGAIHSGLDGHAVVRASSFIANDAGSGKGGAISATTRGPGSNNSIPTPGFVVANSTIQGNTAALGGAVYLYASSGVQREISLINVTMDGNTASSQGGGIYTEGTAGQVAVARLRNTIVSNNGGGNCITVGTGLPVDNVVSNLQFPGTTCTANAPLTVGDPKLNGPSVNPPDILTLSMSLQSGSAASGTGDSATCAAFPVLNLDQRSLLAPIRPAGGPNCDIGAYESSNAGGFGSVPAPGSTITINTLTTATGNATVTISETGSDNLVVTSVGYAGNAEIAVTGPATPFTIADGGGSQILAIACASPIAATYTGVLTVNHNATGTPATYNITCNVNKANQVIAFANPGPQPFDGVPVLLTATVPATGPVTFTPATPLVCSVAGNAVTKLALGNCTINADHPGDADYNAAPQVQQTFAIVPTVPDAPIIGIATPGDTTASIAFLQPPFDGGSPVTGYVMTCNPGNLQQPGAGSPINYAGLANGTTYTCSVIANNIVGPSLPSGTVDVTPIATPTPPLITSANATTFTYNTPGSFNVTAAGTPAPTIAIAGSAPGVNFAAGPSPAALSGTPTAAGVYPLTFTATNGNLPDAVQPFTLTVNKANQVIAFANPGPQTFNAATVALVATVPATGPVTFTPATPLVCSVAGANVTKITAGLCTINADHPGDANYNAAPQVPQSFAINPTVPGAPIIGIATPGNTTASIAFSPPLSNGGSPITGYVMTCNPGNLQQPGAGSPINYAGLANGTTYTCSVIANNIVGPSLPSGTVDVTPSAAPAPPLITSANATTFTYNTPGSFNVTATGTPAPTIAIAGSAPGVNFAAGPSPAALSGTPTAAGVYPLTFTATNGNLPDAVQPFTLTVNKANQVIAFANPGPQTFNAATVALVATVPATGPVTFTPATPLVCSVAGANVTKITAGLCTINADHPGDANYNAAPQVPQSFAINPTVPGAPIIGIATPGNTTASIAFSPPASNGGSPITGYVMTCNPGNLQQPGAGSPINYAGLANGTTYTCSVVANNIVGPSLPSGTVDVTPSAVVTGISGPSGTGTGTISVTSTGGGPTCGFVTSQFLPAPPGAPPVPPVGVAGVTFPQGLFEFTVGACTPGSGVTFTITYPQALPLATQYWKYGPTASDPAPHWYVIPATIVGNTATFTITDGGLGDDDLAANGTIVDQGGPGVGGGGVAGVPTLSEWMLALLALLLGGIGMRRFAGRGEMRA